MREKSKILGYLKPQGLSVLLLAVLLLSSIALQLLNPQVLRAFIDAVSAEEDLPHLIRKAVLFLTIAVAAQVIALSLTYLGETVAWKATNALRLDLTAHCLALDMSFHKAHTPGELIARIDGDVNMLGSFFSDMALRLLANILLTAGILILLFVEDWRAGLIGISYAALTMIALRAVRQPLTQAWAASRQAEADLFGFFGERLLGTEDIRANGAVASAMRELYALMRRTSQHWTKAKIIQGFGFDAVWMVTLAAKAAALALGAWLFYRGRASLGTVYLIFGYISQMEAPINAIRHQIADLQRASASIRRVEEMFHTSPSVVEAPQPIRSLPAGPLPLAVKGVSFRYNDKVRDGKACTGLSNMEDTAPESISVLHDVSFSLEPGQVLGLLGRTGSGKTTLSRLLFRLYDPTQGIIQLGGVDLRALSLSTLRTRVGLVTQDVQLFHATVRNNLTLFKPGFDDEQLLETLQRLGLWTWFQSLPDGLDTVLQTGNQALSAGQAQMLAFARVFLRDPGLVILDEASSRLDPATEQHIERAIDLLLAERTAIVIAHRLHTVQRADIIMILEQGQVSEHGPRERLAADPQSQFSTLLRTGVEEVLV